MKFIISLIFLSFGFFSFSPKSLHQIETEQSVKKTHLNILVVGDSNSAGLNWTWNYLLEKDHPEWTVVHITKGGKRTDWMIENLQIQLSKTKFDWVFIYGGNNDVMTPASLSKPLDNVQKMVDMVHAKGGKVVVICGFDAATTFNPEKQRGRNRLCDVACYCEFKEKRIKYQKALQDSIDCELVIPPIKGDLTWTPDGIHASASKHVSMKSYISDYLSNVEEIREVQRNYISSQFQIYESLKISTEDPGFVKTVQYCLVLLGYNLKSGCNGEWNQDTQRSFEDYQNKRGLFSLEFTFYSLKQNVSKCL